MLEKLVEREINSQGLSLLRDAMEHFNATGAALQDRYRQLQLETIELRELLKKKEAEVKRNERLAMLGKTAAAIAHEIRNPLCAIKLFLSMLRDDNEGQEGSLKLIDSIHSSIERLDTTVGNILQFAKERTLEFTPVNLHSLIQEQVEQAKMVAGDELAFELSLKGLPFINASEDALRRVFSNLLLNAAQAMKNKGTIWVSTREDPKNGLRVVVKDNGPGIAEEIRDALFEPFVTTRGGGTGLGLAIVRQIVEQHNGTISVRSDSGAEFSVFLPYVSGASPDNL